MKYIEQMALLLSLDIDILHVFVEAIFIYLEELTQINKDLMMFTNLI